MNERYSRDLERGRTFQDHVAELFAGIGLPLTVFSAVENQVKRGESLQGIEIKLDERFKETGNLFIETEERSHPHAEWHRSFFSQSNIWAIAIGDYAQIYVLSVRLLKMIRHRYKAVETETSKGFLLPLEDAEKYSIFFLPRPLRLPHSVRLPSDNGEK